MARTRSPQAIMAASTGVPFPSLAGPPNPPQPLRAAEPSNLAPPSSAMRASARRVSSRAWLKSGGCQALHAAQDRPPIASRTSHCSGAPPGRAQLPAQLRVVRRPPSQLARVARRRLPRRRRAAGPGSVEFLGPAVASRSGGVAQDGCVLIDLCSGPFGLPS